MDTFRRFSFLCRGLPADTFSVVLFSGEESLSKPYEFVIDLVSTKKDLDMDDVVEDLSELKIYRNEGYCSISGILARFEQLHSVDRYVFYRAVLVPRLWALKLTSHNQIFLDKSAPEFINDVLMDSGVLSGTDVEFRLMQSYPKREYVCQYGETHFDFVSRWMEREGMYYFFEQTEHGEKMVITDTSMSHAPVPGAPDLRYSSKAGMDFTVKEELAMEFVCEQNLTPKLVKVRDYNYRNPSLELKGESKVAKNGMGTVYVYGDNFKTSGEAERQAVLRAEIAKKHQKKFKGKGTAPFLRAGYMFALIDHYRDDFNQKYLTCSVKHEGDQSSFLLAGLGRALSQREAKNYYRNKFKVIEADVQFRPERTTPRPKISGTMNAVVDAEGAGQYAHLDDKGRYKVRLPFDESGRPEGHASSWIRMAEPYSGDNHGMHFPLLKGAEVLLTFIDGDPDRPIIASAVPNFEKRSIVDQANTPANAIKSASGNQLVMGDKKGQEFIGMWSPFHKSSIAVGSTKPGGGGSISIATDGEYESFTAGSKCEATIGANNTFTVGVNNDITAGIKNELNAAIESGVSLASRVSFVAGQEVALGDDAVSLKKSEDVTGLTELKLGAGVDNDVDKLVTKAKKALGLSMAGSVLAGAGIFGASAPHGEDFLKDASFGWKAFSQAAGYSGLLAGGIMTGVAVNSIRTIVEDFRKIEGKSKTTTFVMNKQGAVLTVNGGALAPKYVLEVNKKGSTSTAAQKSTYTMTKDGEKVEIINQKNGVLSLDKGKKISLKTEDLTTELDNNAGAKKITIKYNAGGEITVAQGAVEAKKGDCLLKLDATAATMEKGSNSVAVKSDKIEMKFGQVDAGPLKITATGTIQLG